MTRATHYNTKVVLAYFEDMGLPTPVTELQFSPHRRFRFDFAWPDKRIALEVEGGIWTRGAHGRGSGIVRDIEKYNLAALNGWWVFRVQPRELCTASTIEMLTAALAHNGGMWE